MLLAEVHSGPDQVETPVSTRDQAHDSVQEESTAQGMVQLPRHHKSAHRLHSRLKPETHSESEDDMLSDLAPEVPRYPIKEAATKLLATVQDGQLCSHIFQTLAQTCQQAC